MRKGETLGIIGPNGAGKSTLLKLVARVQRPTRGRVWVRGRVASLLELGAGFDHELTGRENVFLNSAILGHRRADIAERFDRIVDFAGIRDFIQEALPPRRVAGPRRTEGGRCTGGSDRSAPPRERGMIRKRAGRRLAPSDANTGSRLGGVLRLP